MINTLRSKILSESAVVFSPIITILKPVQVSDKNGNIVRSSEYQPFDIAGSLAPFKSSDFSISSLESVGALSKLTTTYMSSLHDLNVADKFDNLQIPVNDGKTS